MSILKMLRMIILLLLCLCHIGMMLLLNLVIILWKPFTRIPQFYNIIRRKPMARDGKPPPALWNDVSLGKHGFVHLKKGIKLHYVASGNEDNPLMLFLHGFLDCWYSWRFQIREFSKNYRVVAIDLRGFSLSDHPAGRSNYTMDKYAGDVSEVIDALGYQDCILVGYELGSVVAMNTAARFPEKISKMIVFNQGAGPSYMDKLYQNFSDVKYFWPLLFTQIPYSAEFLLTFDDFKAFPLIFYTDSGIRKENLTEEDIEVYKYAFSQNGAIYNVLDCYRNLIFFFPRGKTSRDKVYWNILIIHGLKDKWINKEVIDDSKQYFPNGVFKSVADGTHFMHEDQPGVINDLINGFLNEGGKNE